MDWGRTPAGKRYASCSCGWRAPARTKLTHGMSDVRDHLSLLRRQAQAQGWQWAMIGHGMGLVLDDDPTATLEGDDLDEPPPLRNPNSVNPRSRAQKKIDAARRVDPPQWSSGG